MTRKGASAGRATRGAGDTWLLEVFRVLRVVEMSRVIRVIMIKFVFNTTAKDY